MALIVCKECAKEFSTDAKRCPHCGAKKPAPKSRLGILLLILLAVAIVGGLINRGKTPEQIARAQSLDLTKPVYLAKDAVECGIINVMGTYLDGQRAGGEAEGHRAIADLFLHPKDGCVRAIQRERVHVLDAIVSADKLVTVKCITEFGKRCDVRPQDLGN